MSQRYKVTFLPPSLGIKGVIIVMIVGLIIIILAIRSIIIRN